MKGRFNTIDTIAIVIELQKILSSRVNQIYDIDNKTYLIKLNAPDSSKITLLFESGSRIHTTNCDWPKNPTPSGFTMKLRKHIKNKRIIKVEQLGCDRIIDIQFGTGEAAYHLILEFFNRGNIVLADHEYTIVSLLRVYTDAESHHFATREKYAIDRARKRTHLSLMDLENLINTCKKNDQLKKCLLPSVDFGLSFLEHCLQKVGLSPDLKLSSPSIMNEIQDKLALLVDELASADNLIEELKITGPKGYISYVSRVSEQETEFAQMVDFNPYPFVQNQNYDNKIFESFGDAVDEYFSKLESQKLELNVIEKENEAMKKVNKIRADQESRLQELSQKQISDKMRADRIMNNAQTVEEALKIIRSLIAGQMSWGSIRDTIEEAQKRNDPIACLISKTKFQVNQISMLLRDPFADSDDENTPVEVDVDLSLSAHANATRYYDHKRHAALKEKRTIESQKKAMKSAEKHAREIMKTVQTQKAITISRKVFWFEKFFWFISSDNYLVIGGRDQKQNELIVKRYMKAGDLYVHADLVGASSIVIKNPGGTPVPPRTIDEAGHMAVCFSNAWDSKVICRAWWVYSHQVSKTAPAGEYLVAGSFMIRGQKNYILPTHLQLGFSFLFKIDESSVFRHVDERKPKLLSSDMPIVESDTPSDGLTSEVEIQVDNDGEESLTQDKLSRSEPTSVLYDVIEEDKEDLVESLSNLLQQNLDQCLDDDDGEEKISTAAPCESEISFPNTGQDIPDDEKKIPTKPTKTRSHIKSDVNQNVPEDDSHSFPEKRTAIGHVKDKKKVSDDSAKNLSKLKRGQKSKLKKIKEKYKDQDDEEKQLRMAILQSAGSHKKVDKKGTNAGIQEGKGKQKLSPQNVSKNVSGASDSQGTFEVDPDIEEGEEREVSTELDMLPSLTGQPHPEDELHYALPIVAPYSSVLNNKFKMKIVPGISKRGKAARAALEHFVRIKECSPNEKELLKCVPDQLLARNFPGKVKLLSIQSKKP